MQLAIDRQSTRLEVTQALHAYLLKRHAEGKRVVVFVEESQGMPLATLEEIRLLSNLETTQEKLLQIVLFGQPELDLKLAQHAIRQLNERITFHFHLTPLNAEEIRHYLNARLHASGYRGSELFSPAAVRGVARSSRGLSRRINVLADKALLAAFTASAPRVSGRHVAMAAHDSRFEARRAWRPALLAGGVALLMVGVGWFMLRATHPPRVAVQAAGPAAPSNREFAALSLALSTPDRVRPRADNGDESHGRWSFDGLPTAAIRALPARAERPPVLAQ